MGGWGSPAASYAASSPTRGAPTRQASRRRSHRALAGAGPTRSRRDPPSRTASVRPTSPGSPPRTTPASKATRSPGCTGVSRLVRRHGSWREVIQATSCPEGVVTPAAAMASMKSAVSCRSVTPGTNTCVAVASASSATRTEARMASISSGLLTRRTWRSIGSPSMNSATRERLGQQIGRRARHGVGCHPLRRRRARYLRQRVDEFRALN